MCTTNLVLMEEKYNVNVNLSSRLAKYEKWIHSAQKAGKEAEWKIAKYLYDISVQGMYLDNFDTDSECAEYFGYERSTFNRLKRCYALIECGALSTEYPLSTAREFVTLVDKEGNVSDTNVENIGIILGWARNRNDVRRAIAAIKDGGQTALLNLVNNIGGYVESKGSTTEDSTTECNETLQTEGSTTEDSTTECNETLQTEGSTTEDSTTECNETLQTEEYDRVRAIVEKEYYEKDTHDFEMFVARIMDGMSEEQLIDFVTRMAIKYTDL